jgi:epoxide hydrolase-like predicted phosphatase
MGEETAIRLVISDFGGVICTFDYRIFCERLGRRIGRDTEEIYATAYHGDLQAQFEQGRLTGPEYHRRLMNTLGADVPYAEFFPMYGDIFTEVPGTCEMLRRLHTRYPLYLLSDTNEIHFGYVKETVEAVRLFDQYIVSYEVGAMKPEPRIYQEALRRSGLPAGACVFIDDRSGNVEGAKRVGMHAVRFISPEQCAAELARLGVVVP